MMQSSPGETPFFVNSRAAYPAATPPPRITYTNALPISFGSPSPTKTLSALSLSLSLSRVKKSREIYFNSPFCVLGGILSSKENPPSLVPF